MTDTINDVTGGGYICSICHVWVNAGEQHTCPAYKEQTTGWICGECYTYVPYGTEHTCPIAPVHKVVIGGTQEFNFVSPYEVRMEEKMDKIIELLEKAIGEI